jgi:hypothetical protein
VSARVRRGIQSLTILGALTWAPAAGACATCISATEGTREAYYGTTALLGTLPLLLVGSIGWWLFRASRARNGPPPSREPGETASRSAVHPPPPDPRDT